MRPGGSIIRCHKCRRDTEARKYLAINNGAKQWVNACDDCGATYPCMAPGRKFRTARERRILEQVFGG